MKFYILSLLFVSSCFAMDNSIKYKILPDWFSEESITSLSIKDKEIIRKKIYTLIALCEDPCIKNISNDVKTYINTLNKKIKKTNLSQEDKSWLIEKRDSLRNALKIIKQTR